MNEKIKHPGIIASIEHDLIHVKIMQSAACGACKVSAHCSITESKNKIVDVRTESSDAYTIGERVIVSEDDKVGLKAALYAYLIPLFVMVATLVIVLFVTGKESAAALSAFFVLIPYYILIYLFRNKIKDQIRFDIEKIDN